MDRAIDMALQAESPRILPFTVRRVAASKSDEAVRTLASHLGRVSNQDQRIELMNGLNALVVQEDSTDSGEERN
jgi:hypothetical protein